MKKILITFAILVIAIAIFIFVRSHTNNENHVSKPNNPYWTSAPTVQDAGLGFSLTMPNTWQELSYHVEKSVNQDGSITYSLSVPFKDENGQLQNGMASSDIVVFPLSSYSSTTDQDAYTYEDQKLGSNNKYVFVSRLFSPEAFGECYSDHTFYNMNKTLCDEGSDLRNPERIKGAFHITEAK